MMWSTVPELVELVVVVDSVVELVVD